MYDEYDGCESEWIDVYGHEMSEFSILTSIFEMFYDNSRIGNGCICYSSNYIHYVKVKSASIDYGLYDCFFDCVHSSMHMIKDFNISLARKFMKIRHNIEVPIRSIRRFIFFLII